MKERQSDHRRPVGLTLGDPASIGPEVLVKALLEDWDENLLIIGHEKPVLAAAEMVGGTLHYEKVSLPLSDKLPKIAILEPPDTGFPEDLAPGRPGVTSGWLSFKYLELGTTLTIENKLSALVTLPVSKSLIARKVPSFRGHTEYLQERTGAKSVRMMLGTEKLRITLVTTHCALSEVPSRLTTTNIAETIKMTHSALKEQIGKAPAIVVCALNPHASDAGLIGREEEEIITPGVIAAEAAGCNVAGPYPADTALAMTARGLYDAAVAMYHDQALIALKLICPNEGTNITIGLPFIRTSPLHGTAFDIAGKGIAAEDSLVDALKWAIGLVRKQLFSGES